MKKTVVIDVVGLSSNLIGKHTPFLENYSKKKHLTTITPMLPAVTTAVQSTYLTGKMPNDHGVVGNGWYDNIDSEIKFWKQSNKLVLADKIWDKAKKENPDFTCANMFWWYNMYSTVDFSVTPRPNYLADGRKLPDCYAQPAALRDILHEKLGTFPLFQFWGPGADITSSKWIAEATKITEELYDPTLTFVYLPHLDYCLQKFGPDFEKIGKDLSDIDAVVKDLVDFYTAKHANIIILSEYGIVPVNNPIHLNRLFRNHGLLQLRIERGLELLDAGASKAFVVADHQIAHVYVNDKSVVSQVKNLLEETPGIALILDEEGKKTYGINHDRAGDFVLVAAPESWFTYYFWLDDTKAPDYARCVDIFKKPGYDPVEMFMSSKFRAAYKLLKKKAGFRYVMDVIPLDANLIKGSHGSVHVPASYFPVLITDQSINSDNRLATEVYEVIWSALMSSEKQHTEPAG